jgi:hypothetical protein
MSEKGVLLIAPPWTNYRAPSIQIAALKAYLEDADVSVTAEHFFFRVADWLGFEQYDKLRLF